MVYRKWGGERIGTAILGGQFEELVNELNLPPNIGTAHPPRLPLPDHVHRLVSLNRSACRLKFAKALLGVNPSLDRSVVLFKDVVQVLHRPVSTTAAKGAFLL